VATYVVHKKNVVFHWQLPFHASNAISCHAMKHVPRLCKPKDTVSRPILISTRQRNSSHHLHQTTKLLASEGLHLQEQIKVTRTHAQMVKMFQSLPMPLCLKVFHWTCPMAVYSVNVDVFYALPDDYPKLFCSTLHLALWDLMVANDTTDIKSKSITCDMLDSWQFPQMWRAWMAPFVCVAFQSGLLSSCPYVVTSYNMVQKFAFIFLLFKAEDDNITCVCVCARAHVCVCMCACVCAHVCVPFLCACKVVWDIKWCKILYPNDVSNDMTNNGISYPNFHSQLALIPTPVHF